jgi:hypothetical protein
MGMRYSLIASMISLTLTHTAWGGPPTVRSNPDKPWILTVLETLPAPSRDGELHFRDGVAFKDFKLALGGAREVVRTPVCTLRTNRSSLPKGTVAQFYSSRTFQIASEPWHGVMVKFYGISDTLECLAPKGQTALTEVDIWWALGNYAAPALDPEDVLEASARRAPKNDRVAAISGREASKELAPEIAPVHYESDGETLQAL